jgi:Holliday junction resolvase RusA-like endonuclease
MIAFHGQRLINIPSPKYHDWHKGLVLQLKAELTPVSSYPVRIGVMFFGLYGRRDLDNMLTSLLDTLVDSGIIEDDSFRHVSRVSATVGSIAPKRKAQAIEPPYMVITIKESTDE